MRTRILTTVKQSRLTIAVAAVLVFMGCHERRPYHHYQSVNAPQWAMTDTMRFTQDQIEREGDYTVGVGVRVNDHFAYRNLWLVVEQRSKKGLVRHRDTVNMILADSKGTWLTQGVVLHETEETVGKTRLERDEAYEFLVYHIMSKQQLVGVKDVGLSLSPD